MGAAVQEKIEYRDLRLQCALAVQSLLEFRIIETLGEHGKGVFRVRLETDSDSMEIISRLQNTPVVLLSTGVSGNIPLFSGYPETVSLSDCGKYWEAEITVLSGTARLDRTRKNRVFQTPGQSYRDIIGRVLGSTSDAAYIMTVPDREAEEPVFQYGETDWEFLSRVCSRLGVPLTADTGNCHPRCYIGLSRGDCRKLPVDSSIEISFDRDRFYKLLQRDISVVREDFFCYHITTGENLRLGDYIQTDGRRLWVNRKEMMLQSGEIVCCYCLAGESYALTPEIQNTDMIGLTLSGEVKGTEGKCCELALDLEPGQSGGHQYPFAPATCNFMYCMPQSGTKVYLNLGIGEGRDASITGCIRTNGADCPGTGEPSKRSFHTEYGKGMGLYPDSMGLTGGGIGSLYLDDLSGTNLNSASGLLVYAKGNIILDGGLVLNIQTMAGIFGGTGEEGRKAASASMDVSIIWHRELC